MNFTREPIIETVITPREGCTLVVRNSKGAAQEDYIVEAVEVVSFGNSLFFRSQERPKAFLVPVSDYEVLELKEARMVLKNASTDRSIKIGGGREPRPAEPPRDDVQADSRPAPDRPPLDRKRDNKRRRGRRGRDRHEPLPPPDSHEPSQDSQEWAEPEPHHAKSEASPENGPSFPSEEPPKAPSFISKLFPPPPTLIKESLSRYKPAEEPSPSPDEAPLDQPPSDQDSEDDNEE